MIYVLDNITNREKVSFSNALRNVTKIPAFYINYYNPVRELMNTNPDNLGMSIMGGDEFLTESSSLGTSSFGNTFKQKKERFDLFEKELKQILRSKLDKCGDIDVIIDGILDESVLSELKKTRSGIAIIKGNLIKENLIFGDDSIKNVSTFTIDIDEKKDLTKLEEELDKFLSDKKTSVVKIETITPILQAA